MKNNRTLARIHLCQMNKLNLTISMERGEIQPMFKLIRFSLLIIVICIRIWDMLVLMCIWIHLVLIMKSKILFTIALLSMLMAIIMLLMLICRFTLFNNSLNNSKRLLIAVRSYSIRVMKVIFSWEYLKMFSMMRIITMIITKNNRFSQSIVAKWTFYSEVK